MTWRIKRNIYKNNKTCFYCGTDLKLNFCTIDHKVPRKKQGKNDKNNIVLCCSKCNKLKGSVFDYVHFKEIISDVSDRDFYWEIRKAVKDKVVKNSKLQIKQIWEYRKSLTVNSCNISRFKKARINYDRIETTNMNIKKEIKKILRKIHLQIEEQTKKKIKNKETIKNSIEKLTIIKF